MASGDDILRLAARHIGESYRLGARAPMNNPRWKGPWDCAEFTSWCVFQVAGFLYGTSNNNGSPAAADAYTGFWQRDSKSLGQRVSVELAAQTPGAFVLRFPQPRLIGHIAISDGRGGTVEAHSSRTGVLRLRVDGRRWDTGVLVPGITFTQKATAVVVSPPVLIFRLTTPMMESPKVREIQRAVKDKGFNPGTIDGVYGPNTVTAVNAFQVVEGLVPDGEVGPETAAALGITLP